MKNKITKNSTLRDLLQIVGTEFGREMISHNIWVNALFSDYKPIREELERELTYVKYPNWIITDVRFENEVKAIEDRGGVIIRIDRQLYATRCLSCDQPINIYYEEDRCPICDSKDHNEMYKAVNLDQHESETALDNHKFKYSIGNNSTIEKLIETVKIILTHLEIIK